MWCLETIKEMNELSHDLAIQGKPPRDALFLLTDQLRQSQQGEQPEAESVDFTNSEQLLQRA